MAKVTIHLYINWWIVCSCTQLDNLYLFFWLHILISKMMWHFYRTTRSGGIRYAYSWLFVVWTWVWQIWLVCWWSKRWIGGSGFWWTIFCLEWSKQVVISNNFMASWIQVNLVGSKVVLGAKIADNTASCPDVCLWSFLHHHHSSGWQIW